MAACALIVDFTLHPGRKAAFLAVMREHARLSQAEEPGCLRFDVLEPEAEEDRVLLVEVYVDRAAYEAHRQGPRMPVVGAAIAPLIASRALTICAME
jgi:quinol monooxygenase YgiN